jgi:hypothetical protein
LKRKLDVEYLEYQRQKRKENAILRIEHKEHVKQNLQKKLKEIKSKINPVPLFKKIEN